MQLYYQTVEGWRKGLKPCSHWLAGLRARKHQDSRPLKDPSLFCCLYLNNSESTQMYRVFFSRNVHPPQSTNTQRQKLFDLGLLSQRRSRDRTCALDCALFVLCHKFTSIKNIATLLLNKHYILGLLTKTTYESCSSIFFHAQVEMRGSTVTAKHIFWPRTLSERFCQTPPMSLVCEDWNETRAFITAKKTLNPAFTDMTTAPTC